eukprot:919491-Pyramimonas_sp.AAC.1
MLVSPADTRSTHSVLVILPAERSIPHAESRYESPSSSSNPRQTRAPCTRSNIWSGMLEIVDARGTRANASRQVRKKKRARRNTEDAHGKCWATLGSCGWFPCREYALYSPAIGPLVMRTVCVTLARNSALAVLNVQVAGRARGFLRMHPS